MSESKLQNKVGRRSRVASPSLGCSVYLFMKDLKNEEVQIHTKMA